MKTLITLTFVFITFFAQAQQAIERNKFTLAADVSPYIFRGFSAKVGFIPKTLAQMEFSLELFAMQMPEMMIKLNSKNADANWSERVKFGAALYTDYKLGAKKNAFYLGGGLVYLNHQANNDVEKNEFSQLEYLLRASYKWFPFKNAGFYVQPYCAFAVRHRLTGDNGSYALTPFLLIPSVYLSWEI